MILFSTGPFRVPMFNNTELSLHAFSPMLAELSINSTSCLSITLKILQVLRSLQNLYFSNTLTTDFPAKVLKFSKTEVLTGAKCKKTFQNDAASLHPIEIRK